MTEDGASAPATEPGYGEPLSLAHRSTVEPLLREMNLPLSEYGFANLYLFRDVHRYALVSHPLPHMLGVTYDGVRHAMPLVRFAWDHVDALLEHAACIYPVTEEIAQQGSAHGMRSSWNDDDSDYIYEARRLALLEGKTLRHKRIEAASFAAAAAPSIAPLTLANRHQAIDILDLWARQVDRPRRDTDVDACQAALDNFEALGLHGRVISDGAGVPCAFLLAQNLGENGAAVHFAKGDREREGIYPYMFSQFAASAGVSWLNFEQDLGKPGLRQAKRALDPVRQLRKYRLLTPVKP
jgi:uncharacterized protein